MSPAERLIAYISCRFSAIWRFRRDHRRNGSRIPVHRHQIPGSGMAENRRREAAGAQHAAPGRSSPSGMFSKTAKRHGWLPAIPTSSRLTRSVREDHPPGLVLARPNTRALRGHPGARSKTAQEQALARECRAAPRLRAVHGQHRPASGRGPSLQYRDVSDRH